MAGFSVDVANQIAVLTIDRPKANAIDSPTSRAMGEAFLGFEGDPKVRVVIVIGAGERFFSAGWDLTAGEDYDVEEIPADTRPDEPSLRELCRTFDSRRAEYIKRMFGKDWLDAGSYDLSIDTGSMGVEVTVDLIEMAARRHDPAGFRPGRLSR